ncbi:unnamed protein product [Leptosia nina]|uniref:LisH domain-containing protein n=1 Tax=Leptosia nina TaxID=320188 RepID=A0AAV1J255_9NEOP
MENVETEHSNPLQNNPDTKSPESSDNFQKFIYELFEKNGILNDLRAYLRGHIVNVLKCANSGGIIRCQKHFTQRLELTYQAINILIAEYLLKMEFNYTLSVFVSEIPLANMIFEFNKTLLSNIESSDLSFRENDIWSVLNCLGLRCDSEHACKIIEMYKSDRLPLLLCLFKCMPMYSKESIFAEKDNTSEENLTSDKSTDTLDENYKRSSERRLRRCKHYALCVTCQNRMLRLKEKNRKRKTRFLQMFEQLKSVYESELEMIKEEQDNKIKKSIANHALLLQKHREELEESYRDRESELQRNIDEKKKFLWNLAKSLRQQHDHMTKAMDDVKSETERLSAKEINLKTQIQEAENLLKKRGEDMRKQISDELRILEQHLYTMKKERDSINIEKEQLGKLKENSSKSEFDTDNVKREYDLLKNELQVLKQFVESTNMSTKCLADKETITESFANNLLNNENIFPTRMNKVNNDLKQKNVNFSLSNDEICRDYQRPSPSSQSSDDRECCDHNCNSSQFEMQRLRAENHRLNVLARQQSDHIATLANERTHLHSEFTFARPQTAPSLLQQLSRSNQGANNAFVSSVGGGEQLNTFPEARPRVLIPTDALPFIGVLRDRHSDNRRQLINQWRSLRRRVAPQVATSSRLIYKDKSPRNDEVTQNNNRPFSFEQDNKIQDKVPTCSCEPKLAHNKDVNKKREKSPKSVLREAKEKLRNNHITKELPPISREKSPNTTLREAKLRLRKLEIEAEAVERSYQDFRRRQREEKLNELIDSTDDAAKKLDINRRKSLEKIDNSYKIDEKLNIRHNQNSVQQDFDKYLKEYQTNFHIPPYKNKNAISEIIKPIPVAYSEVEDNVRHVNYLETPMTEFRKLYHTRKAGEKKKPKYTMNIVEEYNSTDKQELDDGTVESNKENELKILKDNINKIYNLTPNMTSSVITPRSDESAKENSILENISENIVKNVTPDNLLRVDLENTCETNSIKVNSENDVLVVVESSLNTQDISDSDVEEKTKISTQMTILVSPKDTSEIKSVMKSPRCEKLTENDLLDAIFHSKGNKDVSSIDMQLELSKISSLDKDGDNEYPDDFSADVDNYNSRSDEEHSPISLAKDSEHNFWDS